MNSFTRDEMQRPRLGRGLAALLGDPSAESEALHASRGQRKLPIEHLRTSSVNPRKQFDSDEMENLAQSIRSRGVLQPILVRAIPDLPSQFEIVAGERRWRAAQLAGLAEVPVLIIEANDKQSLEIAIVENVQRNDLNAMEEAEGYQRLCVEHGYTHLDLAKEIGKSRSHVANTLRLLNLPLAVRKMLTDGEMTAGHARALLAAEDPFALAKTIKGQNLSVRDVEQAARISRSKSKKEQDITTLDAHSSDTGKELSDKLGMKVTITRTLRGGKLIINYASDDQLTLLLDILMKC